MIVPTLVLLLLGVQDLDDKKWLLELGKATEASARTMIAGRQDANSILDKFEIPLPLSQGVDNVGVARGLLVLADSNGEVPARVRSRLALCIALKRAKQDAEAVARDAEGLAALSSDLCVKGNAALALAVSISDRTPALARSQARTAISDHEAAGSNCNDDVFALEFLGGLLAQDKEWAEAIEIYRKVSKLLPESRRHQINVLNSLAFSLHMADRCGEEGLTVRGVARLAEAEEDWNVAAQSWTNAAIAFSAKPVEQAEAIALGQAAASKGSLPSVRADLARLEAGLMFSVGRYDEALRLLDDAWRIYRGAGMKADAASCLHNAGTVLYQAGRRKEGNEKMLAALKIAEDLKDADRAASMRLTLARSLVLDGRLADAVQLAEKSIAEARFTRTKATARSFAASLYAEAGQYDKASQMAREAIQALVSTQQLYEELWTRDVLAQSELLAGRKESAVAEVMRSKARLDQVLIGIRRSEEVLAAQRGAAYLPGVGATVLLSVGRMRDALDFVESAKGRGLPNGQEAWEASIEPGELVLEIAVADPRPVIFAVSRPGGVLKISVSQPDLGKDVGKADVRAFAVALARGDSTKAKSLGHKLYSKLLKPFTSQIAVARSIVVCLDGYFYDVPFEALIDEKGRYLIESMPVSYAPNLKQWAAQKNRSQALAGAKPASLTITLSKFGGAPGDRFRGSLAPLAGALAEGNVVRRLFPGGKALTNQEATKSAFFSALPNAGIIHIATHAVQQGPTANEAALVLWAGKNDSGMVYSSDLVRLRLRSTLAVLSACSTYAGSGIGSNGIRNMAWGFLAAGCPSVISTRWKVDDRAALFWTKKFYEAFARSGAKAAALRLAALALMRSKQFNSPTHWAAWTLTGAAK